MEPYLRVGLISSTHGLKGEVKVFPTTDDVSRFEDLERVVLDTGKEYKSLTVTQVKYFKNQVILKFKEFDDINDIEKYKGCDLLVSREDAVELEDNENFIVDLIGLKVQTDDGRDFGTLVDVLQTGANDVYVVKTADGQEVLLPAIPSCILDVDLDEEIMQIHLLEGLLD
ncbi:MAG: 16S rRNA processing protein RimM [Lachnospiraceae bacterium]|nr:16S rRNA processing protein RimM [Lachnospiraceae bacterium]